MCVSEYDVARTIPQARLHKLFVAPCDIRATNNNGGHWKGPGVAWSSRVLFSDDRPTQLQHTPAEFEGVRLKTGGGIVSGEYTKFEISGQSMATSRKRLSHSHYSAGLTGVTGRC